jgi:hypothetical protein
VEQADNEDGMPPAPAPIPRSCSDVYRLWAAIGLGIVFGLVLEIGADLYTAAGFRRELTPAQLALQEDFGSQLFSWLGFAIAYLLLGFRAFAGCDHEELARRMRGRPLPRSRFKRLVLAGGGDLGWPVLIAIWAFGTVIVTVINKKDAPFLVLALAGFTILTCLMIITFSFALHYARKDIEEGGLHFSGDQPARFSD